MRVNRINVLGIELLAKDRNFEAESLLKKGLALDPRNPFTLNNLGVTEETIGDIEQALKYYDEAAASHSMEPIVVTLKRSWRGKPVSEMAANSANELRKRMRNLDMDRSRAAMLAIRGVSATNRNDWSEARKDFLEAYHLDPNSAFALNNRGYVAERDGDPETAQSYYARARRSDDSDSRVGLSTQESVQGLQLADLAEESNKKVGSELDAYSQHRRGQKGQIKLIPRNERPAVPESSPAKPLPGTLPDDSSTQRSPR
jgi:Flp pilus assembly protein TadD